MRLAPDCSLELREQGGFAGPAAPHIWRIHAAQLDPAQQAQLAQLLQAADLAQQPPQQWAAAPKSWDFEMRLCITQAGQQREWAWHSSQARPGLQALAEWLKGVA
ncbi:protealysin inhibitor emfourin [Massilia sp. W12]|uniref:protealysin inhibitor emfourin n=1 Tax=Massilia sp. W12 TaxID=3126507 RepID=UPI0030CED734